MIVRWNEQKKKGKKRSFLNKIWWGGDIGIWKKIGKNAKPKIPMPSFNCYVCWEKLNDILTLWRKTEKAHTRNVSFWRYCNSQSVAFLLTLFLIGRKAKPWQSRPFCTLSLSQRVVWLTHFRKLWTMSMWGLPKNKKKRSRFIGHCCLLWPIERLKNTVHRKKSYDVFFEFFNSPLVSGADH